MLGLPNSNSHFEKTRTRWLEDYKKRGRARKDYNLGMLRIEDDALWSGTRRVLSAQREVTPRTRPFRHVAAKQRVQWRAAALRGATPSLESWTGSAAAAEKISNEANEVTSPLLAYAACGASVLYCVMTEGCSEPCSSRSDDKTSPGAPVCAVAYGILVR